MEILSLARVGNPQGYLPEVLDWIHEAGNPYFDWLLGDSESARTVLETLVRTDSSELSIRRVSALVDSGKAIGGFIALGDRALRRCRNADALILMTGEGRHDAEGVRKRAMAAKHLFPPVRTNEYYLSKIGVLPNQRRRGLGTMLLAEFLASGRAAGFSRFRLDVSADNAPAIRLYDAAGFRVASASEHDGMRYVAMTLDR
jgi:ribosomal protein S18 acetylase RimI-like enzyme